ncbi:actin cytoskeleton organization protein App1, putative [Talaromyces stipitatus ATCC 10500]|uniref:Actin cytoskeleton organization protein App1, putative n=1 Tax=Talaromyces stipitatus (strain ATCC 10500 / CBS 375.48 / QM 6759 / NRRL 1006) TaxID=441959 RepID=B8MQP1_TALSN|nr:actin cytoskeleton organization protein App1, putative [Talaromyces stipitatus ATCC 10500]EED13464.1 actin cytoskeleton organization protein App1, putative [Talaromyces stipitatus ATCC 10500]
MSRFGGYGSEGWGSDDSGRETGSRRQKVMGYLKAANEIRQTYQSQLSQKWQEAYNDRGVDAPGAFPDYDITSSGKEEMLLFPSYARRHVKRNNTNGSNAQSRLLPGTNERIEQSSDTGDEDFWREEWEKYEDNNAIVDVDVRGWLYTPQNGPMNPLPINHPVQRHAAKREEEDANREAQYLIDKGEQDADVVWRSNHAERDPDLPKRVTRSSTTTLSPDKNDVTVLNTNLMNRLKPFMHNPSVDTPVTLFFYNDQQSQSRTTLTNESGHFNVRAALDFIPTHVRVLASDHLSVTEKVKMIKPTGVSLISDIDDTIKHSAIASGAKEVFWNTFVRDFNDLTIEGVREWYGKLHDMGVSIHYVSNSPWQLYPQLKLFFEMAGLPNGSFHLKQYSGMLQGIFEPTAERKRMSLEKIVGDFPERKFILVGDSGEADLEVYTELVQQNPGRVLGVFIRDVTTTEKKEFFDHSFASQRRSGYSTPASSFSIRDSSDLVENRPPLPPRKPSSPQTIDNGDLMNFEDDSSGDDAADVTDKPAAKESPIKPSKPAGLRTVVTTPVQKMEKPADAIRRKPAPPLPSKPSSLSTSTEAEKKPPPLPQRRPTNGSYTEAVKNIAMDVYNNLPSTKDTLDSLSHLSLKHDPSQSETMESTSKRGTPPPVPPARRGTAVTSTSAERKSITNTPPPPPPTRNISRQSTFPTSAVSTTRQTAATNAMNSSAYYEYPEPAAPILNKREELWRRRWERAQQILSDQGVVLGSWRVGCDVQDVTVWLVENAMKKEKEKDDNKREMT